MLILTGRQYKLMNRISLGTIKFIFFVILVLLSFETVITQDKDNNDNKASQSIADSRSKSSLKSESIKSIDLFKDTLLKLEDYHYILEMRDWYVSIKQDQAFLDSIEQCLQNSLESFITPEVISSLQKQNSSERNKALNDMQTIINQSNNLRYQLWTKTKEIQKQQIEAELQELGKNIKNDFTEIMHAYSKKEILHYLLLISLILVFMVALSGLGTWACFHRKKGVLLCHRFIFKNFWRQYQLFWKLNSTVGNESTKTIRIINERLPVKERKIELDQQLKQEYKLLPTQELAVLYNKIVSEKTNVGDFWQRYDKITTIGIINAEQRVSDETVKPIFGAAKNGDFYAVEIEEDGQVKFAVVPKFGLIFSEAKYKRGSLGFVFKCQDFEDGKRGNVILIKKPAFFQPDAEKKKWELIHIGEISIESVFDS